VAYNRNKQIEKVYYTIGEVAAMFNVNPSLIRFWEREFEQLSPKKNGRGNRVFSKKDVELFHKIHHLVKDRGYTLDGARKMLRERAPAEAPPTTVLDRLTAIRSELVSLMNDL
jgi:DNA-binding transcriptional MerR regulator